MESGRGRGRRPSPSAESYSSPHHLVPAVIANSHSESPFGNKNDVSPSYGNRSSKPRSVSNKLKDYPSSNSRDKNRYQWRPKKEQMVDHSAKSAGSLHFEPSLEVDNTSSPIPSSTFKDIPNNEYTHPQKMDTIGAAFDICLPRSGAGLKPSLLVQNRRKRDEAKRSMEGKSIIELRSGMILLKKYLSFDDQVKIVKECRELGIGPGGFYEPGFRDGGNLHLKMMCLGQNWDPEKSAYGDTRPSDGAKPPLVPSDFIQLVEGAIEACHSFLRERSKGLNVGRLLPSMSPNICIVNFYTTTGRLGLHQDKDESVKSISEGLSVVSFSIGDSAMFLYGDQRDPQKAEKVVLESGDVLIFGGKSRLVFHGVASIQPNTAPNALLEETGLRSGRLNLTFRES